MEIIICMRNSTCNKILKSLFDGPVLLKYYCFFFFFYEKGMQSVSEDPFTVQYPDNAFNCLLNIIQTIILRGQITDVQLI